MNFNEKIVPLAIKDIRDDILDAFERKQVVEKIIIIDEGEKRQKTIPFIDDWDLVEKREIIQSCFIDNLESGGYVAGVFFEEKLIAFVTLKRKKLGMNGEYVELKMLHVSGPFRHLGLGASLFHHAVEVAQSWHAKKIYISAHSAYETQRFYERLGCVDAVWLYDEAVKAEPWDIQLEYVL